MCPIRLLCPARLLLAVPLAGLLVGCPPPPAAEPQQKAEEEVKPLEREARLVDKQAAMAENPKLVEVTNTIDAVDPVSAATQGYFAGVNKALIPMIEREVVAFEIENNRNPTFDELKSRLDRGGVKLLGLKSWQMYAYDESDGTITVLSDPDLEAAGQIN